MLKQAMDEQIIGKRGHAFALARSGAIAKGMKNDSELLLIVVGTALPLERIRRCPLF
jgi:hypothetical protein